ncbi:branched-chain amino acid ABC transporter permease [Sedimentibacter saalensis]|jgi:branched-chain amino acid transport system permease protein|uniref:Amino acid/amide ABC transporter membrane protein 1 (HAAT family) n=1 Tax=Sedimentibacter saalensis TaxID=130788 RepID=A0A562JF47_9FIRM|nr:branched-chain amino acid ABC transporter permease [Sedimentibacter saalensis]MEA5096632.1 branched-chain amino acid ABC transporter permease [Sedimentibacter saalensis]TWH81819.1 amino acid/amide ABC transporter membrane protein 1 (HAAT family) [Sedimentibacter saalensis]
MSGFLQQVVNGLSIGSVYALMAVGYSLVYSIMNFSNFAHGGVIMIGAYIGYFCLTLLNVPFFVAFLLSAIGSGLLAVSMERVVYRPLRKRNAPFLYFIISAMGASIFLENIVIASPIGPTFRTYPAIFSTTPIMLGNIALGRIDLLMFVISTVSLAALIFIIEKTKIGLSIRATSYNIKGSTLMGVNVDMVIFIIFAMGGILAGLAGMLFGMKYTVYPQIGNITTKSFIAAVFGGLGSLQGAVIGSILLGLIETMVSGYFSSQYRDLIAFALLIFVLVAKPTGLMGKNTEDKA